MEELSLISYDNGLEIVYDIIATYHDDLTDKNYIVYRYTCNQQAIQREKLEKVKNEYEYTTERIHQLAEDVDFAKNLAREKMKLSDVGEIIFHFE